MFYLRHRISHWLISVYLLLALGVSLFFLHTSIHMNRRHNWEHKQQQEQLVAINCAEQQQQQQRRYSFYEMPKRRSYPARVGMGECPPLFGKVTVIVLVEQKMKPLTMNYGVAQGSLECYIRGTNYTLTKVDLDVDVRGQRHCSKYQNLFFKKHCIVAHHLNETDWMLVLDADTGVVNPNHCIEEWIDNRVDLMFYERFFNWEIMSGNYLVRNTPFARQFLLDWADMEFWQPYFSSADNGALQLHILKTVLPTAKIEINACERHWNRSVDYDTLMSYTTCVRNALGAQRIWPPKLRIYRRAHGFARDWFMTDDGFSEYDFMFHGWKPHNISGPWKSPFDKMPNPSECRRGSFVGWHWRKHKRISVNASRVMLEEQERHSAEAYPLRARMTNSHLTEPDIANCYPHCDAHI